MSAGVVMASSLERGVNRGWDADLAAGLLDVLHGRTKRSTRREIERERDSREDALVIDGERGVGSLVVRESAERDELAGF